MKSILRQLNKYVEPIQSKELVVPETQLNKAYDPIMEAIRYICVPKIPSDVYEKTVGKAFLAVNGYSSSRHVGILFPLTIDVAYFLFYVRKMSITSEEIINNELFKFLGTVDRSSYMHILMKSLDNTAQRLFLARILLATCNGHGDPNLSKFDILPIDYRMLAANKLGCFATARDAANIIDTLNNSASTEQIILGRIAYLAFWHWAMSNGLEENMATIRAISLRSLKRLT